MEMMAVMKALMAHGEHSRSEKQIPIRVFSDSAYVVNAINQKWVQSWQRKGWQTTTGPTKNVDLWQGIMALLAQMPNVTFHHVKGHNGDEYNERADALCQQAAEDLMRESQGLTYVPQAVKQVVSRRKKFPLTRKGLYHRANQEKA
jgi:ribonuclease HI